MVCQGFQRWICFVFMQCFTKTLYFGRNIILVGLGLLISYNEAVEICVFILTAIILTVIIHPYISN